jgi:hypothetical protein
MADHEVEDRSLSVNEAFVTARVTMLVLSMQDSLYGTGEPDLDI